MIGLVFTVLFIIAAVWIIILFLKFAVVLFLIFLIMACFKVGTLLAYTVMVFAGIMLYGVAYAAVWGND
jgi:hypothetical protein